MSRPRERRGEGRGGERQGKEEGNGRCVASQKGQNDSEVDDDTVTICQKNEFIIDCMVCTVRPLLHLRGTSVAP